MNTKVMRVAKFFVDANFYLSVLVLLYGGLTAISDELSIFDFNEDLFGALHNNLRMALLFLAMTEIVVCVYCVLTNQPRLMLFVGYFLIMMLGSLAFYGKINSVPVDNAIPMYFLYTGVSHILFGLFSGLETDHAKEFS